MLTTVLTKIFPEKWWPQYCQ